MSTARGTDVERAWRVPARAEIIAALVRALNGDDVEAMISAQGFLGQFLVMERLAESEVAVVGQQRGWQTVTLAVVDDQAVLKTLGVSADAAELLTDGFPGLSIEFYADNWIPTRLWNDRPCRKCGSVPTPFRSESQEYDDPCIPDLPGVRFACCGHGDTHHAYLVLDDGTDLRGSEATRKMRELGGTP